MEIGALGFLLLVSLGILWIEGTKTGDKFITWATKLSDIDLDELGD